MASEFDPSNRLEAAVVAFSGGSTFAASLGLTNSLVSAAYQYLAGISYCDPYCYAVSHIISVGVGSISASHVNGSLRSYFLERYKTKWLLENQGRHYVENGVLRRVPITTLPEAGSLPEGLAFIPARMAPMVSGEGPVALFLRAIIACAISKVFLLIFRRVAQRLTSLAASLKGVECAWEEEDPGASTQPGPGLDGLEIYRALTGGL